MEYQSTIPVNNYKLKLPKCGSERNWLECYKITEKQLLDEERCIDTINSTEGWLHNQRMKNPGNHNVSTKEEALQTLLLSHPFPKHQGPFERHISELQYGYKGYGDGDDDDKYTFNSYTTFVHDNSQPCKYWSINSMQNTGEPKHVLSFTTTEPEDDIKLHGPASDLNMSIMYSCNKHGCVIMCPCTVCEIGHFQCLEHHVDLHRKFDLNIHSFTMPCSSNKFLPLYKDCIKSEDEFHTGHRYAGIPRSCTQCRLDLLDHQMHHHVIHHRCKFCAIVLMILEADEPMEKIRQTRRDVLRKENRTCSFCYKICTTHGNRVFHERTEHQYIKRTDLKRPGSIDYNGEMYNQSSKLLRCSICKCSCDDSKLLKRHKLEKHGVTDEKLKKPFSCDVCECSYASKTALNYHTMSKHIEEEKTHNCHMCEQNFSCEMALKRHIMSIHSNSENLLQCDRCDKVFKRKDNLSRHNKYVHHIANVNHHYSDNSDSNSTIHSIRPYKCPRCGAKFKRKEHLENHKRTIHQQESEEKIHKCLKCDKTFMFKKSVHQHVKETHMNNMYQCDYCDMIFQKQSNLNRHQISVHVTMSTLKCPSCDKVFKRKDNLLRHIDTCYRK